MTGDHDYSLTPQEQVLICALHWFETRERRGRYEDMDLYEKMLYDVCRAYWKKEL